MEQCAQDGSPSRSSIILAQTTFIRKRYIYIYIYIYEILRKDEILRKLQFYEISNFSPFSDNFLTDIILLINL